MIEWEYCGPKGISQGSWYRPKEQPFVGDDGAEETGLGISVATRHDGAEVFG